NASSAGLTATERSLPTSDCPPTRIVASLAVISPWSGPMRRLTIDRRTFLECTAVSGIPLLIPGLAPGVSRAADPSELEEATVAELQAGMASGKYTSRSI